MKLTRKCKQDFDKWYKIEFKKRNLPYIQGFDISDISIKYGVYVDFFDSVGVYTSIEPLYDMKGTNRLCIYSLKLENNYYLQCKDRQEAREQLIIKANEIYNKSNE